MRKLLCCAVCALLVCLSFGFVSCAKPQTRCRYTVTAEYFPDTRTLSAEMCVTVPNTTETALEELKFELWGNAFREGAQNKPVSDLYAPSAYYRGMSYGNISVTAVDGAAGFEVCGEDENILSVRLEHALYPDECVTLNMKFDVVLAEINHRLGVGEHTVNLANFYPVLCAYDGGFLEYVYAENGDPFVSECADYCVTLTVPKEYSAFCSGESERNEENGKAVYSVTAQNVRDIAFVLGTELKSVSAEVTVGGKNVKTVYAYYADETPETALSVATESLKYFSETFGNYAYPCYTVVQTDFPYGGMEYPALSMISGTLAKDDVPTVIAHETAHQWWYAAVGSNQFEAAWQDEGLAEFSTALFLEHCPEYGDTYAEFVHRCENGYRAFFSVKTQLTGKADTSMTRPLTSFSGAYEYRNIAYDKGVILFDRVRSVIGEKKLFAALQSYYRAYAGKIASTDDLIACFHGNAASMIRAFTDGTCVI